jgi:hypothetical protein
MTSTEVPAARAGARQSRAPWVGLVITLMLVALATLVPRVFGWDVAARSTPDHAVPPLHGMWDPKLLGPGTLPAVLIALAGWRWAIGWAERLSWRALLLWSYGVGLAWLLALAFVDGTDGISRVLGNSWEYLPTARDTHDVSAMLHEFVDRIPYSAAPDNWPTHVAGHPPGALLVFIGLVKVGLGGSFAAGMVVTVLAATTAVAVLVTLQALGAEASARRAAPFLVLSPAAVFMAVSADALFGAFAAWGLAALAIAATRPRRAAAVAWSIVAGLLLGWCMLLSYGLPLLALLALAVLLAARSWLPLPVAVVSAGVVVLGFAALGFAWWEAYPVLNDRYWDGLAARRPAAYWLWGNLAALALSAGPLLGAGLARVASRSGRTDRVVTLLVGAAAAAIVLADASRMSKAEVERIWLPFVPWLLLSTALLPERWRRWGLGLQLLTALLVQQLLFTTW